MCLSIQQTKYDENSIKFDCFPIFIFEDNDQKNCEEG